MPQLDFSTYIPQLVWLAISFIALYLLMARVALPRIATVIEERRDRIASDLDEAERSKAESEAAVAAYEAALAEARGKAHDNARANREKLNAEIDAERAKVDA
ncbi:MAG: F0F1 ATP synthase subunit B', partial [Rhizobiales bacterium]|nr:F0F1 ATP synthase subunit B' [Hyphomicrobiales bacterium]